VFPDEGDVPSDFMEEYLLSEQPEGLRPTAAPDICGDASIKLKESECN